MRELKCQVRELKQGSSSEGAQVSSEGAQARKLKQGSKQARRQAGKQALGRHSVGAMPWRGLFRLGLTLESEFGAYWDRGLGTWTRA